MTRFVAKRVRFRNGEHHSVLSRPGGLPVHEVTLYLAKYRKRGRAANTIHGVSTALALLYRELGKAGIDLLERFRKGEFLTVPELNRIADAAQYWVSDLSYEDADSRGSANIIDIKRIRMRRNAAVEDATAVIAATQANRIRYIADFLNFLSTYIGATLSAALRQNLALESAHALQAFRAQVPQVSKRAKLGAREGLSREDQDRLLKVIRLDSPDNPWERGYVRYRNLLIVVLLLATGMRRGELLGIQLEDLDPRQPKLRIIRRADAGEDPRRIQPNTKTRDREVELRPNIMRAVWTYIRHHRKKIKAARKHPQLIVADDGQPLSLASIDKIFAQLRAACPGLPVRLTSHVMRHTWNERFSEEAGLMGLTDAVEEKARNEQQGWADDSKSASTYTRRHTNRIGREISLKIQEQLDVPEL
ncbi:Tyrosine recombinase XerC [Paraburkholderia nemoris]|uniref:Phage integrase family protein n=1 Tax=Paraburkholderia aspalathi TaxID=1324617 RepID=A0A1I7EL46_9BURK|nr:site-specific integrase [Paraburkholderia aspalathi]MBK5150217.1 site-specific integrase [Burkholderia sp. R-69608]CAE6708587.1 Tyrosine recombinase XerC [Paraburkholderia nemoris]CAE6929994.1 Tyrosine recombinase XerC [Paraburkholderia nemoris]SFU24609.1 Phage integrase family protein [Paraburkholderia aspalathi]